MAAEFQYKGLRIYVTSAGTFKVDSRDDIPAGESFAAAKAAIDKALKADREPFQALMFAGDRWDTDKEGIVVVTVRQLLWIIVGWCVGTTAGFTLGTLIALWLIR